MSDSIHEILGPGGKFSLLCEGYEHRDEQIEMAVAVLGALEHERGLLVEAGTGVGKTVAYLIPAVLKSSGGRPIVISTHTIALQSQLINKDIPLIASVMDDHPFNAVLMKGRSNYVCLNELDQAESTLFYDDPLFKKVKKWAAKSETGDITELDFRYSDWGEVCCNQDTCRRQQCRYAADRCFYYKMRRKAESADIVVVNHSLFLSDLAIRASDSKSAILPDYGAVIFDEAHHLEDVAGDTFGIEFSNYRVTSLVNRLKKRKDIAVSQGEYQMIDQANQALFEAISSVNKQDFFFDEMFETVDPKFVELAARELISLLSSLNTQVGDQEVGDDKELKERLEGYRRMISRAEDDLHHLFFSNHPNYFKWAEKNSGGKFVSCFLHYSPVNVSDLLKEMLWKNELPSICTSATLSNSGTFSYLKNRLGIDKCDELILGSPFDYMNRAMIYVPADLPIPSNDAEYSDLLAERIKELLIAAGGRVFMLFTSYRMLNAVFERLVDDVPYRLLRQGEMSNETLISEFREDESSCLMGVHSFWEGVDVKGERLSCVIIDKLPFAVPDSPTNKARCNKIEEGGGNWFAEYAIPQAQIRLKQGFGRLIRTKTDRGVVAILDSRIHTKYYGKQFLRYLPHCPGTKKVSRVHDFLSEEDEQIGE